MEKSAITVWLGGLKDGKGSISTESKALSDVEYSFGTRFEESTGTNPEELIAAALSACFSMALSHKLESEKCKPERIHTAASVTLSKEDEKWSITGIRLDVAVKALGLSKARLENIAKEVKETCPVARVLNAPIDLNVRLEHAADSLQEAG